MLSFMCVVQKCRGMEPIFVQPLNRTNWARFGFLARHVTLPLLVLGSLEMQASREGAPRKLALLGHALEGFGFALDAVQELAGFHREQPNHLVLAARRRHA